MNPLKPLADSVTLQHVQRRDHRERYLGAAGKDPVAKAYAAQDDLIAGQIETLRQAATMLTRLSRAYETAPDMPLRQVVDTIAGKTVLKPKQETTS